MPRCSPNCLSSSASEPTGSTAKERERERRVKLSVALVEGEGLCVGQADRGRAEALPKPSLRAWPSSVVPAGSSVTLRCGAPARNVSFTLKKGGRLWEMVQSPDSTEGRAEFHLPGVTVQHAGEYSCEYHRTGDPRVSSGPSDALLLLVTGYLSKPSLQAHRRGAVIEGQEVTLQCQRPATDLRTVMFALLKAGSAAPVQVRAPAGRETDFSLRNVSARDSGNYSCVYYQARAPFLTSQASPHLELWVAASPPSITSDYTTGNHIRLALAAVIMFITGAFLLEAWCRQRHIGGESG
ncbi:T-cell-interacting, activating receptor on myeloid cells protein 1 isoform X3 [Cervus canadensis]|uniref:T-cell-interacting, activating receptor on myeloid cells protein 1 isoform X3 n=1 Tax=Cervus canadensis TaxID=1574408 RepID=UPI001CA30433|nr:T-cell-interacting, activating receptor on myeloid cells protein 1 isoform X3 [Cervus canadensis]